VTRNNSKGSAAVRRIAILGSMAGTPDGQRKLTRLYACRSRFDTILHDFNGHRGAAGGFRILAEVLRAAWFSLVRRPDVAYLAISRTRFGALRDLLIILPYRLGQVPVVAHVHGAEFEDYFVRSQRRCLVSRLQLRAVDQFIFIHETYDLTGMQGIRGGVIRNPLPDFPADRLTAKKAEGSPSFGFISSFVPGKGIEIFLEVSKELAGVGRWVVAGGANSRFPTYGKNLVATVSAMSHINYLGYLNNPFEFFEQVVFLIFPTSYESEAVPGVVVEALLTGCIPIILHSDRLRRVFGGAPIQWFHDRDELECIVKKCVDWRPEERSKIAEACQSWGRQNFPSVPDWVDRIDDFVTDTYKGTKPANRLR